MLHGHDFLDVFDVLAQRIQFLEGGLLFRHEVRRQLAQVIRQLAASGILGQEAAQIGGVLLQQGGGFAHIGELGIFGLVGHERRREVDTVEHVANVMQDAGGDFGHAGLTGGFQQDAMDPLDFRLHAFAFFDFLLEGHVAIGQLSRAFRHIDFQQIIGGLQTRLLLS